MYRVRPIIVATLISFGLISFAYAQSTQTMNFVGSDGKTKELSFDNTTGQWSGGEGGGSGGNKQVLQQLGQMGVQALTSLLGGAGGGPHPVCVAWMQMPKRPPPPPCATPSPNGAVMGICQTSTLCLGKSAPGLDGAASSITGQLGKLLESIMGGGGGGAGGEGGDAGLSGYSACVLNPASNEYVTLPCTDSTGALIFTNTNSSASGNTSLLNNFETTVPASSGVADTLAGLIGKGNSALGLLTGFANAPAGAGDALEMLVKSPQAQTPAVQQGILTTAGGNYTSSQAERGSIVLGDDSAALVASKRTFNTVTAGFVGTSGTNETQQTLVGRACTVGQWGVISFVFGSFFGDLCKSRGY